MNEYIASAKPLEFWLWVVGLGCFALFCFAAAFYHLRRARLIEDTPTSKIRSAPQGYVELEGWALPTELGPAKAPLSGGDCLWWEFEVARRETTYRNGHQRTRWRTIEKGSSHQNFVLEDDTGRCRVEPRGACVSAALSREWFGTSSRPAGGAGIGMGIGLGNYRYREKMIVGGEKLYALGAFASVRAEDDGAADAHKLTRPNGAQPFLVSTSSQRALTGSYHAAAGSSFAAFLAAGAGFVWLLAVRL